MSFYIPEPPQQGVRWAPQAPMNERGGAAPIHPLVAAVHMLQLAHMAEAPAPHELQARVIPVERFLEERFLAPRARQTFGGGGATPPQPATMAELGNPRLIDPESAEGVREAAPSTPQVVMGVLVNQLRQILTLLPFPSFTAETKEQRQPIRDNQKGNFPQLAKTYLSPDDRSQSGDALKGRLSPSHFPEKGVNLPNSSLMKEAHAVRERVVNPDTSPQEAATTVNPAPSGGAKPGEEWVYRLLDIEAAARNIASLQTKMPSTAQSGRLVISLTQLITQFSKIQYMTQLNPNSELSSYQQTSQHVLQAAKNRLHVYLNHLSQILENKVPGGFNAHIEQCIKKSGEEVRWLETLVAFLTNQKGAPTLPQPLALNAFAAAQKPKEPPLPSSLTPTHKSTPSPLSKNMDGIKPHPDLHQKEALQHLSLGQRQNISLPPVLQPRSISELMGVIQTHAAKNPLIPVHVILPYSISMELKERRPETQATVKVFHHEEKHSRGQTLMHVGGAHQQMMCIIPEGPVIVGDSFKEGREDEQPTRIVQLPTFLLAATAVTNGQFAAWLNEQMDLRTIQMPLPGYIYNLQGHLLALTSAAAPMSQIELSVENGHLSFKPQRYREHHPVVHVSWWGAQAFCESQGFSLPTEEQWERAAGMLPTAFGEPIQKIRYGCQTDEISYLSANYYHQTRGLLPPANTTLPVGFFDGERVLTLAGKRMETRYSSSPWGCFDMSGNVREWVEEDYDDEGLLKVTKGGSYADSPFDLRVAAKLPESPETTNPFTGFRVALNLPEEE